MVDLFWNKLCALRKEVIIAQFYTLPRNLSGNSQKKYEEFQSGLLVSCSRVRLVTRICSITI